MQYLIAGSDVISGMFVGPTIPDKRVDFTDPSLNPSAEVRLKAAGCGIFFGRFSNFDKCRSEVAGDVISDVAVE